MIFKTMKNSRIVYSFIQEMFHEFIIMLNTILDTRNTNSQQNRKSSNGEHKQNITNSSKERVMKGKKAIWKQKVIRGLPTNT